MLGKEFGAKFTYEIQEEPNGLAEAYIIGKTFLGNASSVLMLGDNIFEQDLSLMIKTFKAGGRVAAIKSNNPERFGVVEFDKNHRVISIEEKSKKPKSNYIIPGVYIYDNRAVEFAKHLTPSKRGELEIVGMHNRYLQIGELDVVKLSGNWFDSGNFDSLLKASNWASKLSQKS